MKSISAGLLIFLSINTFAAIDYSQCQSSSSELWGRIDDGGKIIPRTGERIQSKRELKGGDLEVTFASTDPRYKFSNTLVFKRDNSGSIIGARANRSFGSLSKKELALIKSREAYLLAHGYYPGTCAKTGYSNGHNEQWEQRGDCSTVATWLEGRNVYVNHSTITKAEYQALNLPYPWEHFVKERAKENSALKDKIAVAKAYERYMDKNGWSFYSGEEVEFGIHNGKCFLKKKNHLMTNGKTGASSPMNVYDAAACAKIKKVFEKHQNKLNECSVVNEQLNRDYFKEVVGLPNDATIPDVEFETSKDGSASISLRKQSSAAKSLQNCTYYEASLNIPNENNPSSSSAAAKQ